MIARSRAEAGHSVVTAVSNPDPPDQTARNRHDVRGGGERGVVELQGVTKRYGSETVVKSVDLTIREGEFFTLLGPSGSGKTTILRMIAGLVDPDEGQISIRGESMAGKRPYERNISLVFQSLALFPHRNVFGNIAFPLQMSRTPKREIPSRVREALDIVKLPNFENRQVTELSGGQRQRVALARALVSRPALLILDEPLGALDRQLREDMQLELARLHQELDVTILNVTHDQREALMLSDRIGVMSEGNLVQVGPTRSVYYSPADVFVAGFIGEATLIDGLIEITTSGPVLRYQGLKLVIEQVETDTGSMTAVLRSESVRIALQPEALVGCDNCLRGKVEVAVFEGIGMHYEVTVPELGTTVKVAASGIETYASGADVWIGWRALDVPLVRS